MRQAYLYILFLLLMLPRLLLAQDLSASFVSEDLRDPQVDADYWDSARSVSVMLTAQPMVSPRPAETNTAAVQVKSVHDGKWIAFHLSWGDTEKSEAGKLGQFSDAAAIQFPIKDKEVPPPVFMGGAGDPTHIFHWRAQYQHDLAAGRPDMKELYPNFNIDVYPMDYPDWGSYEKASKKEREAFSPGIALGNPQAYKKSGVDEIYAEGFSTSSVQEGHNSRAHGEFKDGAWNLVITRPLNAEGGSVLTPGKDNFIAFAVWQGGKGEVGSRKSVAMMWTPLKIEIKAG